MKSKNRTEFGNNITSFMFNPILKKNILEFRKLITNNYKQGPDFDDMSSFFPCEIDDVI